MKYISFVWWIAKYCDFFYFFLFVICVCLHPHINTPAVNCEKRSKLSTGGYQLTGRVHGLSERSINYIVYLITCKKYGKYYVGKTGCPFRKGIYEHRLKSVS